MVKKGVSILLIVILTFSTISFASAVSEFNLTYDGDGNLVTGDGKYREYNEFNQLIRIYDGNDTNGDILETYIYHPTEDRILIKLNEYDGTSTPDGAVVYVNDNFDRKYDISGVPTSNDTYYAKDENGIVGEIKNGTKTFYHNDHLGSTSALTNSSGVLVENTFYAPYGEIIDGRQTTYRPYSGIGGSPVGLPMEGKGQSRYYYEGKEFSYLTDDYDFNFRKYSPELGIFTQPDSALSDVYDPQQLNRYAFERRNPYKYVDEDGKVGILAPLLIAAGVGAAIGGATYFLNNYRTGEKFSLKGFSAYVVGGAATATIGTAVTLAGGGLVALAGTGLATGVGSQALANVGTDKPVSEGLISAGILGGLSGGLASKFPLSRTWLIKYPSSYFTTKTGQTFISNIFVEQAFSSSSNLFTSNILSRSSQLDLAKNVGGCNPAYQSCAPTSRSSNRGSGGSSGRYYPSNPSRTGETIFGGGVCGVTASCP